MIESTTDLKKISHQDMRSAIEKSGYLIEQRVEPIFQKQHFYTETNAAFRDEETGKSRELDIKALSWKWLKKGTGDLVGLVVLCECENNSQPVVFFKREMEFAPWDDAHIKCSGRPEKILYKSGHTLSLVDFMEMYNFHHYYKGTFATQYCSFQWIKDKKSWIAIHPDTQHDTFLSLIKSLDNEINKDLKLLRPTENNSQNIDVRFYYPVLILQGDLYIALTSKKQIIFQRTNHIQYIKQYISSKIASGYAEEYQIDVITEKFLPEYLEIIGKEIIKIEDIFIKYRSDTDVAINKIVSQAKEKKDEK